MHVSAHKSFALQLKYVLGVFFFNDSGWTSERYWFTIFMSTTQGKPHVTYCGLADGRGYSRKGCESGGRKEREWEERCRFGILRFSRREEKEQLVAVRPNSKIIEFGTWTYSSEREILAPHVRVPTRMIFVIWKHLPNSERRSRDSMSKFQKSAILEFWRAAPIGSVPDPIRTEDRLDVYRIPPRRQSQQIESFKRCDTMLEDSYFLPQSLSMLTTVALRELRVVSYHLCN